MLKRAANSVVIALIAAIFGFTGLLQWTADLAQLVCLIFLAICGLSLLFSLFEEPGERVGGEMPIKIQPQPVTTPRS